MGLHVRPINKWGQGGTSGVSVWELIECVFIPNCKEAEKSIALVPENKASHTQPRLPCATCVQTKPVTTFLKTVSSRSDSKRTSWFVNRDLAPRQRHPLLQIGCPQVSAYQLALLCLLLGKLQPSPRGAGLAAVVSIRSALRCTAGVRLNPNTNSS